MTQPPDWIPPVIAYLSNTLPFDEAGWYHKFMSAYEIGCAALIALGQADVAPVGAARRATPQLPDPLPRWDDLCVAVIYLAEQQYQLDFCPKPARAERPVEAGGKSVFLVRPASAPVPPNIAAVPGLGAARADSDVLPVLQALGLIVDGGWSADAQSVLWRVQPRGWDMAVPADPRFAQAVRHATATLPPDIRDQIAQLVVLSDQEVARELARLNDCLEQLRLRSPAGRFREPNDASARQSLHFHRRHALDRVFFENWRLPDGWLTGAQRDRALGVFHDPLAIQMRRAVLAELHPELPGYQA